MYPLSFWPRVYSRSRLHGRLIVCLIRPAFAISGLFVLTLTVACNPPESPVEGPPVDATGGFAVGNTETAPLRTGVAPQVLDESALEELESLGYMAGYKEQPADTGTTRHDPARAQSGYNLFTSGHAQSAYLVSMDGEVVHTWSYDGDTLYPVKDSRDYWVRVHLADNGDLYAVIDPHGIIKLSKDSELIWHTDGKDLIHHDLFVDESEMIYAIGRIIAPISEVHPETEIFDDTIVIFDPQGRKIKSFSIYNAFRGTEWFDAITKKVRDVLLLADPEMKKSAEAFHTNTIQVMDGSLEHISPLLKKGNAVLCSPIHRNVFIIDTESEKVVWNWFGPWIRGIHQPKFLPNGNWLLFDNAKRYNGEDDAASAVFEYTFPGKELVWEYSGNAEDGEYYSRFSSMVERMENGNTLIVVSNEGRAIEVTPDGDIVWEYVNPHNIDADSLGLKGFETRSDGGIIGTLFQLERVSKEVHDLWLGSLAP